MDIIETLACTHCCDARRTESATHQNKLVGIRGQRRHEGREGDQRQFDVAVTDIEVTYTLASQFNVDHPMRRERSGRVDIFRCSLFPLRSNPTQFQAKARA
jgi:hypothetical protein